jgi:hypothetical protein
MSALLRESRWTADHPIAVVALVLWLAQAPGARADSASCIAKVSSYVAELDKLLSKERNLITPYDNLNERYFPLRDCEVDALLEVVRGSSFIRSISYNPRTDTYLVHFSSDRVLVQLYAHGFNQAGFAHRGGRQNSNTFASAALQAGKLPPATGVAHDPTRIPGELLDFFVPGLNEPLRPSVGQRSSNENGNGVQHTSVSGLGGEPFRESVANTTGTSNAFGRGVLIEGIVYDESEDFARWSPEWIERRPNLSPEDRWIAAPSRYPSCKTRIEPFGDHYYYVAEEC